MGVPGGIPWGTKPALTYVRLFPIFGWAVGGVAEVIIGGDCWGPGDAMSFGVFATTYSSSTTSSRVGRPFSFASRLLLVECACPISSFLLLLSVTNDGGICYNILFLDHLFAGRLAFLPCQPFFARGVCVPDFRLPPPLEC